MSITPEQLAELEKISTYEGNDFWEAFADHQHLLPALIAAASELEELKAKIAKSSLIEVEATKCVSRSGHPVIVKDGTMLVHKDYLIEAQDKTKRMQAHAATARKCHAAEQDRDQWKERAEKAEAFMFDHSSEFRASVRARAASVSAPPGCDFPDPPIEEKSTFILDHPDPA